MKEGIKMKEGKIICKSTTSSRLLNVTWGGAV